jgi:hypothetical protein
MSTHGSKPHPGDARIVRSSAYRLAHRAVQCDCSTPMADGKVRGGIIHFCRVGPATPCMRFGVEPLREAARRARAVGGYAWIEPTSERDTMFAIPTGLSVYLYQKPISMQWGEKKLSQLCKADMKLDPRKGGAFLFFNSKRDQLKLYFCDDTGSQEFLKWMPRGGFMLPAPRAGECFVKIERSKLGSLFRSRP